MTGKEILEQLRGTIEQHRREFPNPVPIAMGLSHSMYCQLKASGRSTSSLHTIQYAVRKIDENFTELGITSVGMLQYYLDVYEKEYNTRLGASKF